MQQICRHFLKIFLFFVKKFFQGAFLQSKITEKCTYAVFFEEFATLEQKTDTTESSAKRKNESVKTAKNCKQKREK